MERAIIQHPAVFMVIYKVITVIFSYSLGKREHSRYNDVREKRDRVFHCAANNGPYRIWLGGAVI